MSPALCSESWTKFKNYLACCLQNVCDANHSASETILNNRKSATSHLLVWSTSKVVLTCAGVKWKYTCTPTCLYIQNSQVLQDRANLIAPSLPLTLLPSFLSIQRASLLKLLFYCYTHRKERSECSWCYLVTTLHNAVGGFSYLGDLYLEEGIWELERRQ